MQLVQHIQCIIALQITLMDSYISHLADKMDGVDQLLVVHIGNKSLIRHHFKDADAVVTGEGGIDHLHNELHALPGRGGTDIGFRQRKLLRLTAIFI